MQEQTQTNDDTLEICGLEYDVAALGAEEASNSEANHGAKLLISYRTTESPR